MFKTVIKVVQFQRKQPLGFFSVERLFEDVRLALPKDISVKTHINRYISIGIWYRLIDVFRASRKQGDVNHVTGDVHYLTYMLKSSRTVLTVHDCVSLERLRGIKYWVFWFFWYWLPAKRCAVITVISQSTKNQLLRYIKCDPNKIVVIYNPVSAEFAPSLKHFDAHCPRILQIGSTENKNIPRVAEALKGLSCKLSIVGHLNALQIAVLKKNNIDYENHVDLSREELLEQYKQSDLIMFASLYEGFGLPIVEANAVGRAVITSHFYSMPEVGGLAAHYVDPYDVSDIRNGVLRLIHDQAYREDLIEHGYINATRFHRDKIANDYALLYRNLAKRSIS